MARMDWEQFTSLENSRWQVDIHCVTRWSKFDTKWRGISLDTIIAHVGMGDVPAYLSAVSLDGYSTNIPTADLCGSRAMIATHYEDEPLTRHHGGPARLLVPHLYFWKSAKWVCELNFTDTEVQGFWETRGYHNYGNPFAEQRFDGE